MAAIRWRWFRPGYWGWRWRSGVSRESKVVSALIGLGAVAVGGYLAADTLGGPTSTTATSETTVEKIVTLRERGRTVRRPVQVVRRVLVTTSTAADGTQVITRRVVSTVPVVRRQVVTEKGRARTVVETQTRPVTDRRTVTDQETVTSQETVTNESVVTITRPVTTVRTTTVVETVPTTVTETVGVTITVPISVSVSLPFGGG